MSDTRGAVSIAATRIMRSRHWLRNGFWAVCDQALFALSNFALTVVLARLLAPAEYGVFAVAYSIFLLLSLIHAALVVEPLLVFGPGRYSRQKRAYWSVVRTGHWAVSASSGAILASAGLVLWPFTHSSLPGAFIMLGCASPFMLLVVLTRRACYVYRDPRLAALSGLMYLALTLGGLFLLSFLGRLTPASALALMGAASAVSGGCLLLWFRMPGANEEQDISSGAIRDHWEYGRWALAAGAASWVPGYAFYLALPFWAGLEATAALRALTNLILPIQHTYVAASALLVPYLVRVRGTPKWRGTLIAAFILFGVAATAYWVFLGAEGGPLLSLLYGPKYAAFASLLWIIGLAPIAGAGVAIAGSALRALERPKQVFWSYAVSGGVALIPGMALLALSGLSGAAFATVLCTIATSGTMISLLLKSKGALAAPTRMALDGANAGIRFGSGDGLLAEAGASGTSLSDRRPSGALIVTGD